MCRLGSRRPRRVANPERQRHRCGPGAALMRAYEYCPVRNGCVMRIIFMRPTASRVHPEGFTPSMLAAAGPLGSVGNGSARDTTGTRTSWCRFRLLDRGADLTTPAGREMAGLLAI